MLNKDKANEKKVHKWGPNMGDCRSLQNTHKESLIMARVLQQNRTVIGEDGILRSSVPADFNFYPKFETSFAKYLLDRAGQKVKADGDRVLYRNADLALKNIEHDNISYQEITLGTFVEKCHLMARAFYAMGLREGHYFASYLTNTTEFYVPVYGAWLCGASITTADPTLTTGEFASQLRDVRPKVLVCYPKILDKIKEALGMAGLKGKTKVVVISLNENFEERQNNLFSYLKLLSEAESLPEIPAEVNDHFDPDKILFLPWTSGTTGVPKGIQHPAKNIRWWLGATQFYDRQSSAIISTCMFHVTGFFSSTLCLSACITGNFFSNEALADAKEGVLKMFKAIDKFKPTYSQFGCYVIMRIAAEPKSTSDGFDLTSLRYGDTAGTAMPLDINERIKRHFPNLDGLTQIFSLAESFCGIALSQSPKYLGYVHMGSEVKVADLKTEEPLGPNQVGEIMGRFHYVMAGYLNRPEENARFWGKDGFVHSGDLGRYDEQGILYHEGRIKDGILYKSYRFNPRQVEEVLEKHPGVKEVGVYGAPHDLDIEHATAAVVKAPGHDVTGRELEKLVEAHLDDTKWLRGGVYFVDHLPRNPQGKVLRRKLHEFVSAQR